MEIPFLIILIIIFIIVYKNRHNKIIGHHAPLIAERKIVGYKKKFKIMNDSEAALFYELRRQLPSNYYIFPNMRIHGLST